jgi:hypothetical protein
LPKQKQSRQYNGTQPGIIKKLSQKLSRVLQQSSRTLKVLVKKGLVEQKQSQFLQAEHQIGLMYPKEPKAVQSKQQTACNIDPSKSSGREFRPANLFFAGFTAFVPHILCLERSKILVRNGQDCHTFHFDQPLAATNRGQHINLGNVG